MSKKTNDGGAPQMTDEQLRDAALNAFDVGVADPDAPFVPDNQVPSDDVDPGAPDDEAGKNGEGADGDGGAGGDDGAGGDGEGADDGKPGAGKPAAKGKPAGAGADDGKPAGKDGKPAAAGADGKAGEGKALTPEEQAAKDKADDDAAIKDLGLKGKSEERFRTMSSTIREQSRQLEALGGAEGIERLQRDAAAQVEWDTHMDRIGATPEQFGQAMGYVAAINSGDVEAMAKAREFLAGELAWLDQQLGHKPDPLEGHQDLIDKVKSGAMDKEDAIAWANDRNATAARQNLTGKAAAAQREADERATETNRAVADLKSLGAEMKQRDGAEVFEAKMAAIGPALAILQAKSKPSEWPEIARDLYEKQPYRAKPAPQDPKPPRVGMQPNRQHVAANAGQVVREPKDAFDAFDMGAEEARARGE